MAAAAPAGWLPAAATAHLPLPPPARCRLQGQSKGAALLAWHPAKQRLLAASSLALVEYDAVSGARRHLAEAPGAPLRVAYAPSGGSVVLLTKVGWGGDVCFGLALCVQGGYQRQHGASVHAAPLLLLALPLAP